MKIRRINNAMYVAGNPKKETYCSICDICKKRDSCSEPEKKKRLTCPDDIHMKD